MKKRNIAILLAVPVLCLSSCGPKITRISEYEAMNIYNRYKSTYYNVSPNNYLTALPLTDNFKITYTNNSVSQILSDYVSSNEKTREDTSVKTEINFSNSLKYATFKKETKTTNYYGNSSRGYVHDDTYEIRAYWQSNNTVRFYKYDSTSSLPQPSVDKTVAYDYTNYQTLLVEMRNVYSLAMNMLGIIDGVVNNLASNYYGVDYGRTNNDGLVFEYYEDYDGYSEDAMNYIGILFEEHKPSKFESESKLYRKYNYKLEEHTIINFNYDKASIIY